MARITINGIQFDPAQQGPELSLAGLDSDDVSQSNYILVQTDAPLTREGRERLRAEGADVIEYHPENAYVCRFPPQSLAPVRALPFVETAMEYPREVKIAGDLRTSADGTAPNLLDHRPIERAASQRRIPVDVIMHDGAQEDAVRAEIARAAGLDPSEPRGGDERMRVYANEQEMAQLAQIDAVKAIVKADRPTLHGQVALGILGADRTHNGTGLRGEGEIVAVCDTGFDRGSTTDVHPAFAERVVKLYALGRNGKANDPNGHGTHVAGSVLGDGHSPAMGGAIQGAAPAARLVLQSVYDAFGGLGGLPLNDLKPVFETPYTQDGARIHTNSWGDRDGDGRYSSYSRDVDTFVSRRRDCVVCFAAGNDGKDANGNGVVDNGSVGAPATAKNCIAVGASETDRPGVSRRYGLWDDFPVPPLADDLWGDDPNGIAAFSSRGPTQQRRIKPDVVAPGTSILSTRSRDAADNGFWGASSDPLFCFMGGTSMATPLVAGCCAVVREHLIRERNIATPSAALVKAMLINGAVDLAGQYVPSEAPEVPNYSEGFGRVDLANTVGPHPDGVTIRVLDEDDALDTGEYRTYRITVPPGISSLKATLVWTDPPGEALQSDLDLIVRTGGEERHGNVAPGSPEFDRLNNVEQVWWTGVPDGEAEVTVRAHRATAAAQTFALVVRTA